MSPRTRSTAWCWAPGWSWSTSISSATPSSSRSDADRALNHLAITDHGRIEGALAARDAAPEGLTVIVGEEIRSREGDLVALFVERPVPVGLRAAETAAAGHVPV